MVLILASIFAIDIIFAIDGTFALGKIGLRFCLARWNYLEVTPARRRRPSLRGERPLSALPDADQSAVVEQRRVSA
jgi:hypothetical protein